MPLGRAIRLAEKQPLAFQHLLYITSVQNSPTYYPRDILALYFTATTDKITDRLKVKSYTVNYSSHHITSRVLLQAGLHKQGKDELILKNLTNKLAILIEAVSYTFLPYFNFDIIQGIHKRMVRFQKLTRHLFLTLHGHNVHRQQRQLSKFLMRYKQFASHAYCGASLQYGVAAGKRFPCAPF